MARPAPSERDEETIAVPAAVRFPVELTPPDGFDPARLETWPRVEGRLEWVGGRLLYMPPCGRSQAGTTSDLIYVLSAWGREHPEFFIGTNDAGMLLGDDVRGADGAIWLRARLGRIEPTVARVPPILAAEVAGRDENEAALLDKAGWYRTAGVDVVWILLPMERTLVVVDDAGARRFRIGDVVPAHPQLPGLTPPVADLFRQVATVDD